MYTIHNHDHSCAVKCRHRWRSYRFCVCNRLSNPPSSKAGYVSVCSPHNSWAYHTAFMCIS